jgi:hypothetical protein
LILFKIYQTPGVYKRFLAKNAAGDGADRLRRFPQAVGISV